MILVRFMLSILSQPRRTVLVNIQHSIGMTPQYGGRTRLRDHTFNCVLHRSRLSLPWNDTEQIASGKQAWNRQCDSLCGNFISRGKTSVMDLLIAARQIQSDRFDSGGSRKRAVCGSLNAICPFSPIPIQTMSTGN